MPLQGVPRAPVNAHPRIKSPPAGEKATPAGLERRTSRAKEWPLHQLIYATLIYTDAREAGFIGARLARTATPLLASHASPHHASHCRLAHTRKLTHTASQRRRRPAPPPWCCRPCAASVRRYCTTSAEGVSQQAPRGDHLQTQLADVSGLRARHATYLRRRRGRLRHETRIHG